MLQDSSASSRFCLPWWLLLPNQAEKRVKFCVLLDHGQAR